MNDRRTSARILIAAMLCLGAGVLALAAGCSRPLLGPTDERSPFDRYSTLR